jgi:hypothetical protein
MKYLHSQAEFSDMNYRRQTITEAYDVGQYL